MEWSYVGLRGRGRGVVVQMFVKKPLPSLSTGWRCAGWVHTEQRQLGHEELDLCHLQTRAWYIGFFRQASKMLKESVYPKPFVTYGNLTHLR